MAKKKVTQKFDAQSVVERAIAGMTKRLERGDTPFSEHECRLFVALIQVQNNRNLMSDQDILAAWGVRFKQIEDWINSRQTAQALQVSTRRQRRTPPMEPGVGVGFNDGDA